MMITTKGRYALHVMEDLAAHGGENPVSLKDIADRQNISMKYLETIVAMLNKAGFVESYRGKMGGYLLSRTPDKYTIAEILELTEGTLAPVTCIESGCPNSDGCLTLPLWQNLDKIIGDYLGGVTLADVVEKRIERL